jgi:hypothetical protein
MPKRLASIAFICLMAVFLHNCAHDSQRLPSTAADFSRLADSITATSIASGRYALVSQFIRELVILRRIEGTESAQSVLTDFFSRLHPQVRISDSLAVLQTVEWIHNCYTVMDSGGVFFTNGDVDTYAAWFLQRVEDLRPDLLVVSLPFLVGSDYRQSLQNNSRSRGALNLSRQDTLPVPPSTSETQDALTEIVTHLAENREHPAVYMAPSCGIEERFSGHIVDLGLVYAYQDSIQPQTRYLDLLMSKLTGEWKLHYASRGAPEDPSYAAHVAWLQYLTLLIRMAPEFEKAERFSDLDTLFVYMEPVVGDDWRFSMIRYVHCRQSKDQCLVYLKEVENYATANPNDQAVKGALQKLKEK